MAWSTPDLSDITQVLKGLLQTAINNSTLQASSIQISCNSPDTARSIDGYCHLTLYLLHVGRDPFWRNSPVNGPRPQLNSAQPLSLNLSYLLTAWCDTDFTSEQRAMSIALQAIHSQPIVTQAVIQQDTLSQWLPDGEFTISIEADTIDEMSRLWQAFTVPIRLSALIRVGVVFIAPIVPTPIPVLPPTTANLSLSPVPTATTMPLLFAGHGQSFQPVLASADPAQVVGTSGPLIAVGGSTLVVAGNGLDLPSATDVFLSVPGTATEWLVTTWRQGAIQPGRLGLIFPAAYADPTTYLPAPPAATPLPGLYNLTVGSNVPAVSRSNAIPLTIAPRVDFVANPPQLSPDNTGLYSIAGAGFVSTATIVALGTLPLNKSAALVPVAGEFTVDATGTSITFKLPNPQPPPGDYPVLIQVNGIAAAPGWVVVVP
jgi:hypothetical protein